MNMTMHKPIMGLLLCLFVTPAIAQQGVTSAGGDIIGAGGSMSFTTGLPDFEFFSGDGGSIQFGLQQAFSFSSVDLPEEANLYDMVIEDGEQSCFAALLTIITAGDGTTFIVESGGDATLIAGLNILLRAGTRVEYGGSLHAKITSDGTFCPEPDKHFLAASLLDENNNPLSITNNDILSDLPEDLFRVFPNPTSGRFTLELNFINHDGKSFVEVYGMRGDRVLREEINPGQQQQVFSLEGYLPGIYIIRVVEGGRYGVGKIIKR